MGFLGQTTSILGLAVNKIAKATKVLNRKDRNERKGVESQRPQRSTKGLNRKGRKERKGLIWFKGMFF